MSLALEAEGLGKAYRLYDGPSRRALEAVTLGRLRGHRELWAVRGVDLALKQGASLGIVGANGAGKSTLLRLLAGTTRPSEGRFRIHGRVASLLDLGAGFHQDFTGRENVDLSALLLGLTPGELERKRSEILEFAELGAFIDEPVRIYSTGMALRLGFSIAAAVDPDVLILDEILAVGDMVFQERCVDHMNRLRERGKTIVFCSHSLYDVRQMCDEAIWLDRGSVAGQGTAVAVTNDYAACQRESLDRRSDGDHYEGRSEGADGRLPRIRDARLFRRGTGDAPDEEVYEVTTGDSLVLRVRYENPRPESTPIHVGLGVFRSDRTNTAGFGTHIDGVAVPGASGCVALHLPELPLLSGRFQLVVILFDGAGVHRYDELPLPEDLVVRTHTNEVGRYRFEHRWEFEQDEGGSP